MSKVEQLEREVAKLSREEFALFRQWFQQFDAEHWDARIEQDAAQGKLADLAREARADYDAGTSREL